jgi:hypothetical protein
LNVASIGGNSTTRNKKLFFLAGNFLVGLEEGLL